MKPKLVLIFLSVLCCPLDVYSQYPTMAPTPDPGVQSETKQTQEEVNQITLPQMVSPKKHDGFYGSERTDIRQFPQEDSNNPTRDRERKYKD